MVDVLTIEQLLLERINIARLDPLGFAARMGFDLNSGLPAGTISTSPKQPLAMSDLLVITADTHARWMLANNTFTTTGDQGSTPGERMADTGFNGGNSFDWAETLNWRTLPSGTSPDLETVATNFLVTLFNDPVSRAILLADQANEVGISLDQGPVGGVASTTGYTLTQDVGASDDRFITGGVFQSSYFSGDMFTAPIGVAGAAISVNGQQTTSNAAGGYRAEANGSQQRLTIAGIEIDIVMPGGNVKVDVVGAYHVRASHSLTILSKALYAELLGVANENLTATDGTGAIRLHGNAGANRLTGNSASNVIDGLAGADVMIGGSGDDIYYVDNAGDVVIEAANEGYDTIRLQHSAGAFNFTLTAGSSVEVILVEGSIFTDPISITGNEFAQEISANHGNNRLDGGGGGDLLVGSLGDDTYIIRSAADVIGEYTNEGNDRALAAVSYTLGANAHVEYLGTIDAAATTAINLTGNSHSRTIEGNAGQNTIRGGDGDDVITGGLGTDRLYGGGGSDRFVFRSAAETKVGLERDVILDWESIDKIDVSAIDGDTVLAGHQAFTFIGLGSVDRLVGKGELKYYHYLGNTYVVGNSGADNEADFQIEILGQHTLTIANFVGARPVGTGTAGNDVLVGTNGADTFVGGGGKDTMTGRGGADTFRLAAISDSLPGLDRDTITDWESIDRIDISPIDANVSQAGHQSFQFLGLGSADRQVAQGAVKYYHYAGNTYLVGNTTADTEADFQIELLGVQTLTSAHILGLVKSPVNGTTGNDTLHGTAGNDAIRGGLGTDLLYGNGGNDDFVFGSPADSVLGFERDSIMDWSTGDRIDLRGMDANVMAADYQSYVFVGMGSADRNVGQGALKYYQYGGNTYVVGNATPDGTADFQIEIRGLHTLTADQFLL